MSAVEIYDLSQKRDFFNAVSNKPAYLVHNLRNGTASLGPSCLRHNAKSAVHVTALHNRDERSRLLFGQVLLANRFLRTRFFADVDNGETRIIHSVVTGVGEPG